MASSKSKKRLKEILEHTPQSKNDLTALARHIRENPLLYAVSVAFVFLAVLTGILYRVNASVGQQDVTTQYARALATEDPSVRQKELEQIPLPKGQLAAEIIYLTGESAYQAKEYDKAKAAFERVRTEYPDSPDAPNAVEGLGYVAEEQGDSEGAIANYSSIMQKWPNSFAARRQSFNIARCQERLGKLKEAVESYQQQVDAFPSSHVAEDAQAALERLRHDHPELFAAAESETQAEPTASSVLENMADTTAQTPVAPQTPTTPQ